MTGRHSLRTIASWATLAVLSPAVVWVAMRTGGTGLLGAMVATGTVSVIALARVSRRLVSRRRVVWQALAPMVVVVAVWDSATLITEVAHDDGGPVSQRIATWGRDHGLGMFVDELEAWWYDTPPSVEPADELAVATSVPATTTSTSMVAGAA